MAASVRIKSESSRSGVLPEEATHFGDAIDKIIWTKFNSTLRFNNNTFVPVRIKIEKVDKVFVIN